MQYASVPCRIVARLAGGALIFSLTPLGTALAFPFVDPSNQGAVVGGAPVGNELAPQDATDLQKQVNLSRLNGGMGVGGWTIIPRLTVQELFTDNAREVTSPRQADLITMVAPGISINADTAHVQLKLDYAPNLIIHAVDGSLNALTQQLNATGTVTVIPDLAYVDIRALSGVQSRLGGLAGGGTLGAPGAGAGPITTASLATASPIGGTTQGLTRQNEVQTTSFGISPYLLRRFGDYGTGKLGVSVNASNYSSLNGFASSPIPFGGTDGQSLLTTEQIAQFTSGEFLGKFKDSFSVDVSQSTNHQDGFNGVAASNFSSQRQIINNQLSFALNRTFSFLTAVGHENINYGQAGLPHFDDVTWSAGFTITPNADSAATLTYGHQNGANAFSANGHYAVTARTLLSFDYSDTVGTQLENIQSQLNSGFINGNGQQINPLTGGPLLVSTNANGVQNGVFRFKTFNASLATKWERDTLTATLSYSDQLTLGGASAFSTEVKTAAVAWVHELAPDLTVSGGASYSNLRRANGGGTDNAFTIAAALQYAWTESTTVSARYSFFDRTSGIQGYSLYENTLLLGVTKKF
jgi:uncharacterized protein (PEP-CTERM system associated)